MNTEPTPRWEWTVRLPAIALCELPGDVRAETDATLLHRLGVVEPFEPLEDRLELVVGMPGPRSCTVIWTVSADWRTRMVTGLPGVLYLQALMSRFVTIWPTRIGSVLRRVGSAH